MWLSLLPSFQVRSNGVLTCAHVHYRNRPTKRNLLSASWLRYNLISLLYLLLLLVLLVLPTPIGIKCKKYSKQGVPYLFTLSSVPNTRTSSLGTLASRFGPQTHILGWNSQPHFVAGANMVCFGVLFLVSLIGTLGQPLFQISILRNYQYDYCKW